MDLNAGNTMQNLTYLIAWGPKCINTWDFIQGNTDSIFKKLLYINSLCVSAHG